MGDAPTNSSWKEKFDAARQSLPPSAPVLGLQPREHTTLELATALRNAEVAAALLPAESPGAHVAGAVVVILREMIGARMYAENIRRRESTRDERIEALMARMTEVLDRGGDGG